ncbi:MAG: hypothetical protein AVDCRST_MAG14-110, partial [uncultured Rubrobacteraceae bacterium]
EVRTPYTPRGDAGYGRRDLVRSDSPLSALLQGRLRRVRPLLRRSLPPHDLRRRTADVDRGGDRLATRLPPPRGHSAGCCSRRARPSWGRVALDRAVAGTPPLHDSSYIM